MTHPVSNSWNTARTLSRITGHPPAHCRSYLATLPKTTQETLATAKRRDNPAILEILPELSTYTPPQRKQRTPKTTQTPTRKSLGDTTKPPRAGAPPLNGTLNIHKIIQLKQFATNYDTLDDLQHHLDALKLLQNT